jgi:hypothetical protein
MNQADTFTDYKVATLNAGVHHARIQHIYFIVYTIKTHLNSPNRRIAKQTKLHNNTKIVRFT